MHELERYVDVLAAATDVRLDLYPGGGCPGPITVDLGRRGRLVAVDTQWLLEQGAKPTPVRHGDGALFAHSHRDHPGFMTLDFLRDGRVRLGVVEWVDVAPDGVEVWSHLLHADGHGPRAEEDFAHPTVGQR